MGVARRQACADHRRRHRHRRRDRRARSPARRRRVAGRPPRGAARGGRRAAAEGHGHRRRRDQRGRLRRHGRAAARAAHGPIDILIANAGAAESAPVAKIDLAHWQRMLDVNLTGAFLTVQAALPDCRRARRPAAASSSSPPRPASRATPMSRPIAPPSTAWSAWRARWPPSWRHAASRSTPSAPASPRRRCWRPRSTNIAAKTGRSAAEAARRARARSIPQGRFVTPEEVAGTVLWLCTPGAPAITGQAISVSGGEYDRRNESRARNRRRSSKQRLRLWLRLLRASRAIEAELRERLRVEFGDHAAEVRRHGGAGAQPAGMTMTELSRFLMVSNGNVTGIIDRLVADRLVTRKAPTTTAAPLRAADAARRVAVRRHGEAHEGWVDESSVRLQRSGGGRDDRSSRRPVGPHPQRRSARHEHG